MSLLLNIPPSAPGPAIERVTDAQTDTLFNFRPGTVDDLANELRAPKQAFVIPDVNAPATDTPEPAPADQRREAILAATQVLDMTDSAASFAIAFIGKREAKNYRLSASDKNIIRPHLAEYLKGKAVDIPPGFLLLFVVLMVYLPIVQRALADRKEANAERQTGNGERGTAADPPNNGEHPAMPPTLNS